MISQLALTAAVAVGAGAVLIPPNVALDRLSLSSPTLSIRPLVHTYWKPLTIPCPSCPYAEPADRGFIFKDDVKNYLFMNFSIGNNGESIELNGNQIYPQGDLASMVSSKLTVSQYPESQPMTQIVAHPENHPSRSLTVTEWGLRATTVNPNTIRLTFSITGLDDMTVNLRDVVLTVRKDAAGKFQRFCAMTKPAVAVPKGSSPTCARFPLLCQVRGYLTNSLSSLRTKMRHICHRKRPSPGSMAHHKHHHHHHHDKDPSVKHLPHHKGHAFQQDEAQRNHRPHHRPHHYHAHRPHNTVHSVAHKLQHIMRFVVPVMIGVVAGVMTYVCGMLIGTAIVLVWAMIRARKAAASAAYAPIATAAAGDEESGGSDDGEGEVRGGEKQEYFVVRDEEDEWEAPPLYMAVMDEEGRIALM